MTLIEKDLIKYIDIGIDQSSELIRWESKNANVGRLDIISARASSHSGYYKRIEKNNIRTLFKKKNEFTFIVAADQTVQFQLLEAIIDELIEKFFEIYGDNISVLYVSGMTTMFDGFEYMIPELIEKVEKDRIVWMRSHCKLCGTNHRVCVKKTLIENSEHFPVSLVFFHQGHGILLYIDANFQVRGMEIVQISG